MSTMRNSRTVTRTAAGTATRTAARTVTRARLAGAAATVALAALSLTACGDGTGSTADDAAKHVSTAPTAVTSTSPSGAKAPAAPPTSPARTLPVADKHGANGANGSNDANGTAGSSGSHASGKAPSSSGKPVTCDGSTTKTVATLVQRPLNHLLLTVTNTGGRTCYLYGYPALRFGEAQSVPPVIDKSHPQAVVTLTPGESGYASVVLSAGDGSAAHGRTEKSLTVYFFNRSVTASTSHPAQPPLPAKGIHIDDSLTTTYWQQSLTDALTW
jgi:hypothetical protein